jgi:hypothetical protein
LRAYFVDKLPSKEVARRFGYTDGSFRVMVHQFRHDPQREFLLASAKGPQQAPKKDKVREMVISMRKQNLSIYDIGRILKTKGHEISPVSISNILKEEGFSKLARRADDERLPGAQPISADVADIRQRDLSPQRFQTKFGGFSCYCPLSPQYPLMISLVKQAFRDL